MNSFPILNLCARIQGHEAQYRKLSSACSTFQDWQELLQAAELHGMAPLLNKHLRDSDSPLPASARRSLSLLARRQSERTLILAEELGKTIELLSSNGLQPIVIKGAALAQTIYPDISLRPMRDIDILLRKKEAPLAYALLQEHGFIPANEQTPPDHYHLRPIIKTVDNEKICIELHRGLFPDCPPGYPEIDFERLLQSARRFSINSVSALTFGDIDQLWYVFEHGFHTPLTYEKYKLINAADLIGLVESNEIHYDWQRIEKEYPTLFRALPYMQNLTPWHPEQAPEHLKTGKKNEKKFPPSSYNGWPAKKIRHFKAEKKGLFHIFKSTFFPTGWWLRVYYGADTLWRRIQCICLTHPAHIFWWARLHYHLMSIEEGKGSGDSGGITHKFRKLFRKLR